MRDPGRIDVILSELRRVWEQQPDLRLGQPVVIAAKPAQPCPEVFHLEDDALITGLEAVRDIAQRQEMSACRIIHASVLPNPYEAPARQGVKEFRREPSSS